MFPVRWDLSKLGALHLNRNEPSPVAGDAASHLHAALGDGLYSSLSGVVSESSQREMVAGARQGLAARKKERDDFSRERSMAQAAVQHATAGDPVDRLLDIDLNDVVQPDVFTVEDEDDIKSTPLLLQHANRLDQVSQRVYDQHGEPILWPWESSSQRCTGGKRRRHRLDGVIQKGLLHSSARGNMGANTTGVRRWKKFCKDMKTPAVRVLEPTAPLWALLEEEWHAMRFIAALVEEDDLLPNTAAGYFGQVQGWHAQAHGVKLAGGMKLNRLPAMLKGLRRVYGEQGRAVRRGIAPQALRKAMDICFPDLDNVEHANIRAALSLALQGLLRGAEFAVDGAWVAANDLTRADMVSLTTERLVVMMRPCKNMQHLSGKTVPLIIGGGGEFIDAVAEMRNLVRVDPVDTALASITPMFRTGQPGTARPALTTKVVGAWTKSLMLAIHENPSQFGTHSYRIGGATALFAAGADCTVIRTMGRWSSDCYRLYVRACFAQTLEWSRRCGSTAVSDVAKEFAEVDCY